MKNSSKKFNMYIDIPQIVIFAIIEQVLLNIFVYPRYFSRLCKWMIKKEWFTEISFKTAFYIFAIVFAFICSIAGAILADCFTECRVPIINVVSIILGATLGGIVGFFIFGTIMYFIFMCIGVGGGIIGMFILGIFFSDN